MLLRLAELAMPFGRERLPDLITWSLKVRIKWL
jgi:hypothetical protein